MLKKLWDGVRRFARGPGISFMAWLGVLKSLMEVLKNLVEVGAIVLAGWWALNKFILTEKDSTELRAEPTVKVASRMDGKLCLVELSVSLKNIGLRKIPETKATVTVYQLSGGEIAKLRATRPGEWLTISPKSFGKGKQIASGEFKLGSIPVGMRSRHDVSWITQGQAGDSSYYYFHVQFEGAFSRDGGVWDRICIQ